MCVEDSKQVVEPLQLDAIVLKFGSSVLRGTDDIKSAVTEIYRYAKTGRKVVAVVSAFAGETDALINEVKSLGVDPNSHHAPRLISLGEERAASLLAIACAASGLNARIAGARALNLRAGGARDDAKPVSVDANALRKELSAHDVVITPGFVALGPSGEPVLLGRGGSDLTAVYLAYALELGEVTLIKDVDGVYDRDPASSEGIARRYGMLSWEKARHIAGKLLQTKAIDFASDHSVAVNVTRANAGYATRVAASSEEARLPELAAQARVGVAGLGVIGKEAALRVIDDNVDYSIVGALVQNTSKPRATALEGVQLHKEVGSFVASGAEIILDALSSGEAGKKLIEAALSKGVSVVSANKQAVAGSIARFHKLAEENGATFAYSASVGGGAPIIETARRARASGEVKAATAILNGTVNFILDELANGEEFEVAVRTAQEAGFAEPDPSADLSGDDARAKIAILAYELFGEEIELDAIVVEPLTVDRAAEFVSDNGAWKQLASIERDQSGAIRAKVAYAKVDEDIFFRTIKGEGNALRVVTKTGRVFTCSGKGAGSKPTVESIFADLGDIWRAEYGGVTQQNPLRSSQAIG